MRTYARPSRFTLLLFTISSLRMRLLVIAILVFQTAINASEDLAKAIQKKDAKKISALISGGADLTYKTESGESMLTLAYKKSNAKIVSLLVTSGASLKSVDSEGNTLAHLAAIANDHKTLKLADNDPDLVIMKNSAGKIPVFLAIEKNKAKAFLHYAERAEITRVQDNEGRNLAHYIAKTAFAKKIPSMSSFAQIINQKDNSGNVPLWIALNAKNYANGIFLVQAGAHPDTESESGVRPLEYALTKKSLALFDALLAAGAKTDFTTSTGKPFLMFVIEKEQYAFANKLIAAGAPVNITDTEGNSLVVFAVKNSHHPVLEALFNRGLSVHSKDAAGKTLVQISHENLMKKYTKYRAGTFKVLLEKGADANTRTSAGTNLLSEHAERNNTAEISLLLQFKANARMIDAKKNMALHYAAAAGKLNAVKLLHEAVGEIDAKGENDFTPLMFAARNGHLAVLQQCIKWGAQVNAVSSAGYTALHTAVFKQDIAVVKALLAAGADLKLTGRSGYPLLMELAKNDGYHAGKKTDDLVKLLVSSGADASQKNRFGNNALMYTINRKNLKLLRGFLKAGASPETKDSAGNTLMHKLAYAALYARLKNEELKAFIFTLYNAGADINAVNSAGRTAVSLAAEMGTGADITGAEQFVQTFSDLGAGMQIRDASGKTAQSYAPRNSEIISAAISANITQPGDISLKGLSEKGSSPNAIISSVTTAGRSGLFYVLKDGNTEYLVSADMSGQSFQKKNVPGLSLIREASGGKGIYGAGVITGEITPGKTDKCKKDQNLVIFIAQFDMTMTEQWRKTYAVKGACAKTSVHALSALPEGGLVVATQFGSKHSLYLLGDTGEKTSEFKVAGKIQDLTVLPTETDPVIMADTGSPVFYTLAGKKIAFATLKDAKGASAFSRISGGYAYAVKSNEIEKKTGFAIVIADNANKKIVKQVFASGGSDSVTLVRKGANNFFYVIGETQGSLHGNNHSGNQGKDLFIMKINDQGTRLFTRQIPVTAKIMSAAVTADGTLLLGGAQKGGQEGPILVRVTTAGKVAY